MNDKKTYLIISSLIILYAALHLYIVVLNVKPNNNVTQLIQAPDDKYNIILATMPKSASVYIAKTLAKSLGYKQTEISLGYFPHDNITFDEGDKSMQKFMLGKALISKNHMDSSTFNTQLLESNSSKIVVHFRDPRAVLLSWVHYLNRMHQIRPLYLYYVAPTPPEVYYAWNLKQQIDWNIDNFLPSVVTWMEGWIKYSDNKAENGENQQILLTTYDEFVLNEIAFYHKILDFYKIPKEYFAFTPPEKTIKVNYRKGDADEWQQVFTSEQKEKIKSLVPANLLARFNWEA